MESVHFGTIKDLAVSDKINSSYVSRVLRLTLLAPDIVEAILDGRQPDGMTLPALMKPFPVEWSDQRRSIVVFGASRPRGAGERASCRLRRRA